MAKKHVPLPAKLFIAFEILLVVSTILILGFLYQIYNKRINEEIYLRIHSGGKVAMNITYDNLLSLQLALKEADRLFNTSWLPNLSENDKKQFGEFCSDQKIDFLCWKPGAAERPLPVNLCTNEPALFCTSEMSSIRSKMNSVYGITNFDGALALAAQYASQKEGEMWKAGIALSEKYINKIENMTGMNVILLSKAPHGPNISTLPESHSPFANFASLPTDVKNTLEQFSVHAFRWKVDQKPYQFIFFPLINLNNQLIGAWGVGFSLKAIEGANNKAFYGSMLFTLSIMLAFLAIGILTARYFLQPLVVLQKTVRAILAHQKNINVSGVSDEVSFLDESFKQMTEELEKSLLLLEKAQVAEKRSHRETLLRLAIAAEYKDDETAAHILRLSRYSELIAKKLGLAEKDIEIIRDASPMHDIGKIGIPDYILQKKGPLTAKEFEIMKSHPMIGANIFKKSGTELYEACRIIALTHHERWDGTGYPQGLKGEAIPLYGRIVAVADVFDALISARHYKPAYTLEKALEIMKEGDGSHFDPKILDAFFKSLPEIKRAMAIKEPDLKKTLENGTTERIFL